MLLHCSLPHSTAWAMFNDHMGAAGCCRSRKGDHPGGIGWVRHSQFRHSQGMCLRGS
jgi:hypothetical protein